MQRDDSRDFRSGQPGRRAEASVGGIVALGDSITRKGPWGALGLPDRSWAWFLAESVGEPLRNLAVDGAGAAGLRREQLPHAGEDRSLALVYVGVNDARSPEWDARAFAEDLDAILAELAARAARTLALTIPADLGRPRAGAKVAEANAIIERAAARHAALILDLRAFGARNLLMADRVHPTAFGQIAIAERALDLLAAAGMAVKQRPSLMIRFDPSWLERLHDDCRYSYRQAKQALLIALAATR
jgi:lysophospholipase L1-like esterase